MPKKVQDSFELVEALAKANTEHYNILKLCEELAELQELLLKYITKSPANKPSISSIVDELGDVIIRSAIFIEMMDVEESIETRIEEKTNQLIRYYNENTGEIYGAKVSINKRSDVGSNLQGLSKG